MRSRLFTIGLAVAVECACASAPRTHSFPDLPHHLEPGSTIRLTETTGQTTTGRLDTLSPASLRLLTDDRPRDVPEDLVEKIERRQRQVGKGALLGLGVGFGVGLIAARSQESSGSPYVDAAAGGLTLVAATALGTAAGAVAGAVMRVYRTVYQAPKPSATEAAQWSRYRATSIHRPATITRSTGRTAAMSRVGSPLNTTFGPLSGLLRVAHDDRVGRVGGPLAVEVRTGGVDARAREARRGNHPAQLGELLLPLAELAEGRHAIHSASSGRD